MEYAEFFSCLTIHFHTKGTYFFEIVPIVYEASRAKLKKGAVGRRLGEDNSHLSNQSFHNITPEHPIEGWELPWNTLNDKH